ncbi:hypothetical protein Tco_0307649 [Tanacetum coccineum]
MTEHRAEVVCYEKYIRVPYGNDMLIIQGERSGVKNESRLEVISSIRTQKDFPEVFPEDLPGLPPKRQVEFHIELIPGAAPVEGKLKCQILQWRILDPTVKFLGHEIDSYYRRFIEGFSKIAKPMTELTQKDRKLDWGEDQEKAFQLLKQKLCAAPILGTT